MDGVLRMSCGCSSSSIKDKKAIQVMNIFTEIKDGKPDSRDEIRNLLKVAKRIESVLGNVILHSDGSLKKGHNPHLITKRGVISISRSDEERFFWEDGSDFFNSEPFFKEGNQFFLGSQIVDATSYKTTGCRSFAQHYKSPVFTLKGLYLNNKLKIIAKTLSTWDRTQTKINFLEDMLDDADKSGFQIKDSLVKNQKTRLKLLENHYKNNAEIYAMRLNLP